MDLCGQRFTRNPMGNGDGLLQAQAVGLGPGHLAVCVAIALVVARRAALNEDDVARGGHGNLLD